MPTDDTRLEQALRDAAPVVEPVGVLDRVAARRTRRRRSRRLATSASALLVVVLVIVTTVLVTRDDTSSPHVAAPGTRLSASVVTGDDATADGHDATVRPVTLDTDPGVLLGPLYVTSTSLSSASHDRGTDAAPPTHVVRIDGSHVVDVVNFKAEIVSITAGEGARWALTRNPRAISVGEPEVFLKRIGSDGKTVSQLLPSGSDPVGPIAAVGGAVWVPVRDGVLQCDVTDGHVVRLLALPPASARQVAAVGKTQAAYVTDGDSIRRLDPGVGLAESVRYGPDVLGLASAGFDSAVLLRSERGSTEGARVARATTIAPIDPVEVTAVLPAGFVPDRLEASPTRLWVTGTVDGAPAVALLENGGSVTTVVLHNARATALAWTAPHTVSAVTDGQLFTISVP